MNKIEMALKRPFPESKIRWRKGGGGAELAYITARDVMDRYDYWNMMLLELLTGKQVTDGLEIV